MEEANSLSGPNTITFAIAGSGVHQITIDQTLRLNDPSGATTIDGYTQPGSAANTDAIISNATILIEITTTAELDPMLQEQQSRRYLPTPQKTFATPLLLSL